MPIERELKFSLLDPPPPEDEILAVFRGSRFELTPKGTARQLDRYFDDAARALCGAGLALRRRRVGGREIAALKREGSVSGAAHEREEVEAPAAGEDWPPTILAALSDHLTLTPAAANALGCVLEIETERTAFEVSEGGRAVALLLLDDVEARYPDAERSALFREVEIEAVGGSGRDTLAAIAERLERVAALAPSSVTKLQRAEAVLQLGAAL